MVRDQELTKKVDISLRWPRMSQRELYLETGVPQPKIAIEKANSDKFHSNSAAYCWNNEPASRLPSIMSYKGKKGFGVLASGDQPFIFFQHGLESYMGFDITQLACFWNELKTAAIKNLSRNAFLDFTLGKSREGWRAQEDTENVITTVTIYDQLRKELTEYAKAFFDDIIEHGVNRNCIASLLNDGRYFRGNSSYFQKDNIPYLSNNASYGTLQISLFKSPYKFVWKSLSEAIELVPKEGFDVIFLSNILDRWNKFGGDFRKILLRLEPLLNKTQEARVIGNYQCGYEVKDNIGAVIKGTGLIFQPHCGQDKLHEYWTLRHEF